MLQHVSAMRIESGCYRSNFLEKGTTDVRTRSTINAPERKFAQAASAIHKTV